MEPQVTVIVPTRNEEKNISACLQSIKKQDYKNVELIIVDNYSSDKTPRIAKKFTPNVYSFGPERSAQRNFGAKKAKGNWLLFLDADQKAPVNLISKCILKIKKNPKIKVLIIAERVNRNGFWSKCRDLEKRSYFGNDLVEAPRFTNKKTFAKTDGYDENLIAGEDWDLAARLRAKKYKIARISIPLINFGKITLLSAAKKKFYYGQKIGQYLKKNPKLAKKQLSFFRFRGFFNNKLFLNHPILALGLLILKTVEFVSGTTGLLYGKIKKS